MGRKLRPIVFVAIKYNGGVAIDRKPPVDVKDILADLREMFGKGRMVLTPEEVGQVIGRTPAAVAGMRARKTFPFEILMVGARKGGVSIYEVADWLANGCPSEDAPESGPGGGASASKTRKRKSPLRNPPEKKKAPASVDTRKPNRPSLGPALLNIQKMIARKQAEIEFMAKMFAALEAIHLDRGTKKGQKSAKRVGI